MRGRAGQWFARAHHAITPVDTNAELVAFGRRPERDEKDTQRPLDDKALNEIGVATNNTFFPLQRLDAVNADEGIRIADYAKALDLKTRGTPDPEAHVPLELPRVLDESAWRRTGLINFREDEDGDLHQVRVDSQ